MAQIVLRCPKTGRNIEPAIEIAAVDFRAIPAAGEGVFCPICGEQHGWLPYAARLGEAMRRTGRTRLAKD
jgi:hypothetical protein